MIKPGYGDNTRIMPSTRICECSLQQVIILLTGLLPARSALLKELDSGVSFRASTSYMEYHFNATAPFPGVHFRLQFSSTNCETNLLSVTSRDTDHFYRIFLQNNTITLYIKLEDGKFEISVSLPGNKTFCDGVKHSVEFNRYGQNFLSEADGKEHSRYKEPRIRKVIFSKPDKIFIGGMSENKFDGCIYSAMIQFYWKKGSQNVSVNLLGQYVKGDSRVRFADVFLGGCPRRGERKNPMEECTRYKNDIYMKSGHGVIVSPRRPQASYVDQCRWFLSAPHNKRLRLSLLFYKVDVFVLCFESKVVVFDGSTPDSDVIERFCYAEPKKVVYTRGNHMLIQMNLPKNGFLDFIAEYDIVGLHEGPCPIERTLNDLYGSIASPYFPNNYGSGHDCSWVIKVPQGYHVLLSFNHTEFHIHSSTVSCDCDFLEVREGGSKGKLLGKYCGSRVPSPIYGSGYLLWLRFVSDKFSSNKGFRASYEAIEDLKDECPWDKTLTSHRGFISSPRYALAYPGNMECIWRINMANNYRVTFVFLGPLKLGPNCSDLLEIREGLDKKSPLLSLQCATAVKPANIVSSGAKLYVRFKSDSFSYMENTESGFQVTYYASQIKSDAIICKRNFIVLTLAAWSITVL